MRRAADLNPGEAKTDRRDAYIIADTARTRRRQVHWLDASSDELLEQVLNVRVPKTLSPLAVWDVHKPGRQAVAAQGLAVRYLLWATSDCHHGGRAARRLVTSEPLEELWLLLGEMTLVAPAADPSPFERRLASAGRDIRAVAILLEQACGLLRQLVCVTGWLVVLAATAGLLVQPHFGPGHLAAPAAGVLAVLQGISPRRTGRRQRPAAQPPRG